MSRVGRIVYYDEITGRGALTDDIYGEKLYKFQQKGYQAGQMVIYVTTNMNPITGYRACGIVAPKLWKGISGYRRSMSEISEDVKLNNDRYKVLLQQYIDSTKNK